MRPGDSILVDRKGFRFAPLVCKKLKLLAEVDITFLRPGEPGAIVNHAGDIDNRVKTLLDALSIPHPGDFEHIGQPSAEENPFFCLLEDDALVSRLAVTTDRLLGPSGDAVDAGNAYVLIHIRTRPIVTIVGNMDLA
jgi:hypothetical protein